MFKYILFKNSRSTTKVNLRLIVPLESLANLTNRQAIIIDYITKVNNYNFILASKPDTNAVTLDEMSINIDYIKSVVKHSN